jgi:farnesyl diphosphate synthase
LQGFRIGLADVKVPISRCRFAQLPGRTIVPADSATLGKTAGKDADQDKPTYVSILGLARSQAYAQELLAQALGALEGSGLAQTRALAGLAKMVVNRSS